MSRLLSSEETYETVTQQVTDITLHPPARRRWWMLMALSLLMLGIFFLSTGWLFIAGVGIWGLNVPVNWGLDIVNTVWWVGIGHAGTMISALLLVMGQQWRNSLNRFAEAMTLFAAICAALFPILHLGKPELFYWMFPYPNTMDLWPQFRSPLVWDVFSFTAYITVSFLFWYVGMIPDLATMRDKTTKPLARAIYGRLALGWRGTAQHWERWRQAYVAIALITFHLVVTVHSGVAMLFAGGPVPGWHTTIFPPFFVQGAVFSGVAVVILLAVVLRHAFHLGNLLTLKHLDILAKLLLATGLLTAYGYLADAFHAWYSGDIHEMQTLHDRLFGRYAWSAWGSLFLNIVLIQLLWFRRIRRSVPMLFVIALGAAVGMWLERYLLIVTGLYRDFLPSSWHGYETTIWEWGLFIGSIGLFAVLFLLFARFLPLVSMFELKEELAAERRMKGDEE
ncbi:NrfD/PsrC family molybdoenzyme membrane anchor subunit [Telmatospirillum sp. J64-1]|uniref:NrfD/PsrC family molybdoenzyme membrane anchor subunit n=1 Tax=Telmatospirillum sp. J64-1 TaxID=2502183 RepID=UPI00115F3944|nr:NrfD/PsrC family molybdoenzyme membrane anchor subunit [Telmatospirillum sp. J64-1]